MISPERCKSFSKYTGCGNDFILFDNRIKWFNPACVAPLCDRTEGVGANGVLLLEKDETADARMRIFNADGSGAEMCGNGLRCFAHYLLELGFKKQSYRIAVHKRIYPVSYLNQSVCYTLDSSLFKPQIMQIDGVRLFYVDTGVPHIVRFVDDHLSFPFASYAPPIRRHPRFSLQGTNVSIVKRDGDVLYIRTYERGVEGETKACGTGAMAAVIAAGMKRATVIPLSLEPLHVEITDHSCRLAGPARFVFKGEIDLNSPYRVNYPQSSGIAWQKVPSS